MLNTVIAVGLAVLLFLCFLSAFVFGLRLGMRTSKGIVPQNIKGPYRAVKDAIEEQKNKKEAEEESNMWDAIDNNDGYTDEERVLINKGGG